jgi:hypothetical protein
MVPLGSERRMIEMDTYSENLRMRRLNKIMNKEKIINCFE